MGLQQKVNYSKNRGQTTQHSQISYVSCHDDVANPDRPSPKKAGIPGITELELIVWMVGTDCRVHVCRAYRSSFVVKRCCVIRKVYTTVSIPLIQSTILIGLICKNILRCSIITRTIQLSIRTIRHSDWALRNEVIKHLEFISSPTSVVVSS